MRLDYLIYPEAEKILEESGLKIRIAEALGKEEDPRPSGMIFSDWINGYIKDMKAAGYFQTYPEEYKKDLQGKVTAFLKDVSDFYWNIKKKNSVEKEELLKAEEDEILLFVGFYNSLFMKPDEAWDFKRYGFSNPVEMSGTIGAFMKSYKRSTAGRIPHKWRTQHPNGILYENSIEGMDHYDLYVSQEDITSYRTMDPLGNEVKYRPHLDHSRGFAGGHSCEDALLVSVLKYIDQQKIKPELLQNNAAPLKEFVSKRRQRGTNAIEGSYGDSDLKMAYLGFEDEMPVLDESFSTDKHSRHGIRRQTAYKGLIKS